MQKHVLISCTVWVSIRNRQTDRQTELLIAFIYRFINAKNIDQNKTRPQIKDMHALYECASSTDLDQHAQFEHGSENYDSLKG